MPTFYFNLHNHHDDDDVSGTELADLATARVEAVVFAGAYLKDNPDLLSDDQEFSVEVTDERRRPVFAVVMRAHAMDKP